MMTNALTRSPSKRQWMLSSSPFSVLLLLIFTMSIGNRNLNMWARAYSDDTCVDDLNLSDNDGDGKVDAEEYVEFCRLRLEERLAISEQSFTYDTSSATITTFVLLPSGLQSNFYTLACLCSRFSFDDTSDDRSCCVGDNAHLSVVTVDNSGIVGELMDDEESKYIDLICSFTNRAIDNVISNLEIIQPQPQPISSPILIDTNVPTTTPTINSQTTKPSTMFPTTTLQPTNITVKTSYSILVEEHEQMSVDDVFDIRNDCIEAMNILAKNVSTELWFDEATTSGKSIFYDRLLVELPTMVEPLDDIGFTSTPELTVTSAGNENDKIFVKGPCPTEMKSQENGKEKLLFSCLEVKASIFLKIMIDDVLVENNIGAEDVKVLYHETLEEKILSGELAHIFEDWLDDSLVIMATGQTVSEDTTPQAKGRTGLVVGLVAGTLLWILIFVHLYNLHRKRQSHPGNEKGTNLNSFASARTVGEEDLEARNFPPAEKLDPKNQRNELSKVAGAVPPDIRSKVTNKSVPYFQHGTSPGRFVNADDAKSTGGISAESDAGWSDAYTSSMGSASDDGLSDLDSPPGVGSPNGPPNIMSLSMGPSSTDIETEDINGVSPVKYSHKPIATTPTKPTSPNSQTFMDSVSPITPKSVQLLEETTSDDENEQPYEDNSDEDEDNKSASNHDSHKNSSEDFRSKVRTLIERIVPEEIDQIDDMISQFKNREDELIATLLAMESRAVARKEKESEIPPAQSSPKGKEPGPSSLT